MGKDNAIALRHERMKVANELIRAVATTGNKILKVPGDGSGLFRPNALGRVVYVDHYTKAELPIYGTATKKWRTNLCHGGGLHWFLAMLCRYVRTGTKVAPVAFDPKNNNWGYSDVDLAALSEKAKSLGVM